MRILFVDDEPRISEGIERMFFHLADEWDITCVDSGPAALQELEDDPYDVIVTDMRMPEMDGAVLLAEVQKRAPGVVRIILSGQADLEETMRAVPLAHQYLAKPCRPEVLGRRSRLPRHVWMRTVHRTRLQASVAYHLPLTGRADRDAATVTICAGRR